MKKYFKLLSLVILATVIFSLSVFNALADENYAHDGKVVICHRTSSNTNPYNQEDPNIQNDGSLTGGHLNHTGLVYPAADWGDIIPPYSSGSFNYLGMNWTTEGKAIYDNGCNIPSVTPAPTPTCAPDQHKACVNQACAIVNGAGKDECSKDDDCKVTPPPTHKACVANACTVVQGTGTDECSNDSECQPAPLTHKACVNNACKIVEGEGANSCSADSDCITPTGNPSETPTPTPTPTPTQSVQGTSTGGDGRSDGLSSCPECTQPPHTQAVLGASTSVLGLSATGGNENVALQLFQFLGVVSLTTTGFVFYRKNS